MKNKQVFKEDLKIICIGGGTGLFSLLNGLKKYTTNTNQITAIVTTLDTGGSSGKLITQYGILPPGDLRNCMVALSNEKQTKLLAKLFQYRFDEYLENHNFGNLLIKALQDITGDFESAIEEASKLLQIKGKVLPVSTHKNTLIAKLEDGRIIEGEESIDLEENKIIKELYLKKKGVSNQKAIDEIKKADIIIFGPGDLYSSILPNLLFEDIQQSIQQSSAKKIVITPIMTKSQETHNFTIYKWIKEIEKYLDSNIDIIISNSQSPDIEILKKYKYENKFILPIEKSKLKEYTLILENVINEKLILRHDSKKLSKIIFQFLP